MASGGDERRLLLVSYYFGDGGGTGRLRWMAMAQALAAEGWAFDVLTLARPGADGALRTEPYEMGDRIRVFPVRQPVWPDVLIGGLARGALRFWKLLRPSRETGRARQLRSESVTRVWPEYQITRSQRLLTALWSVVDSAIEWGWTRRVVRRGRQLARQNRYHTVIVSSPPHMSHFAGTSLSRRLGIPYVADYRDPWFFGIRTTKYYVQPTLMYLGRRFEGKTMARARVVVANTDRARGAVAATHHLNGGALVAIPNGYDPLAQARKPDRSCFRVIYAGCLYPYHDVRALFAASERFRTRWALSDKQFRLEFIGTDPGFRGVPLVTLARAYGLKGVFVLHPGMARAQALEAQQSAAVLVTFDHFHGLSVPMKFYDYAQLYAAPLAIGDPTGALAEAAAKIGLRVLAPTDSDGIDAALDAAYDRWRGYRFDGPIDPTGVFDRKHQTKRMAALIAQVVRDAKP